MPKHLILCLCALALAVPSSADSRILDSGAPLAIQLQADDAILDTAAGPAVRGTLVLSPAPLKPACDKLLFLVDDQVKLESTEANPTFALDTTKLEDGEHSLRIEAHRKGGLFISTGSLQIQVANKGGSAVLGAFDKVTPDEPAPPFGKLYRARLSQEAIWFNGQEGDVERHPFISSDRMYVTLTDLLRHIGGRLVWGPKSDYVEVYRNDKTVRVVPGSKIVKVNNVPVDLKDPVITRAGLAYVPARAFCGLFNIYVEWSKPEKRAYVYAPQPGYAIERRDYPWMTSAAGYRTTFGAEPGRLSFDNHSGLPIHILFQGNGFRADFQVRGLSGMGPVYLPAGTYRATVWSRQGEDFETYVTVVSGMHEHFDITVGGMTLDREQR